MKEDKFRKSIHEAYRVLLDMDIVRPPMRHPRAPSDEFKRTCFTEGILYSDVFLTGLRLNEYSILLENYSFFSFFYNQRGGHWGVRYAYYPNPFKACPFDEFLDDYSIQVWDPEAIEFYHQYLSENQPHDGFTPYRYEVDFHSYKQLRHACSHLHIGHNHSIRLPVEKFLTPKAFVLFMAKHHLLNHWAENHSDILPNPLDKHLLTEKSLCESLPIEWFSSLDRSEFYLS